MFCPSCGDEFRPGFDQCPDCGVDLVADDPNEREAGDADAESVELLRTANVPFLAVIKTLLESAGIPYSVQGEESLNLVAVLPSIHFASPTNLGVRLFVPGDRVEEARALIESAEAEDDAEVDVRFSGDAGV